MADETTTSPDISPTESLEYRAEVKQLAWRQGAWVLDAVGQSDFLPAAGLEGGATDRRAAPGSDAGAEGRRCAARRAAATSATSATSAARPARAAHAARTAAATAGGR